MKIRFRVCKSCYARCKPSEGRYGYVRPVPGYGRMDFICNNCRRMVAHEQRSR